MRIDTGAVLAWGGPRLRDLPWRRTRDPWWVLVAEVMLQQTQVHRVIGRWEQFVADYPSPADCAAAPLGDLLVRWQGLGYPRRARDLHRSAQLVVRDHGGVLPDDLEALLALPGIGPYTARAVLVFAYERDTAVVDTNIARVLARVNGERLTASVAQDLAERLVPAGDAWLWNQVFMDLGATVCRRVPDCTSCPLARRCAWARAGCPDPDPAVGSAGVSSRQAPYAGSRREARGRVLAALVTGACAADAFAPEVVQGLVDDGLVVRRDDGMIALP